MSVLVELPLHARTIAGKQAYLLTRAQLIQSGFTVNMITRRVSLGILVRVARGVYDTLATPVAMRTTHWARQQGWSPASGVMDHVRKRTALIPVLAGGKSAISVGIGALVLHGVHGAPQQYVGEAVVGADRRGPCPGARFRECDLARDPVMKEGVRVAHIEDAMARAVLALSGKPQGRNYAVSLMNDARHSRLITGQGMVAAQHITRGKRGCAAVHAWWDLARADMESPAETWGYLSLLDAGCEPDAVQLALHDEQGLFMARVDFAWLLPQGQLMAVEIKGKDWHGLDQMVHDDMRLNQFAGAVEVLQYSGTQAMNGTVAKEMSWRLLRAGWRPGPKNFTKPFRVNRSVRHRPMVA